MTKPWEETWAPLIWMHDYQQRPMWAVDSTSHPRPGPPGCLFECSDPDEEAAARLAAAAPEMARLLLDLGDRPGLDGGCARCLQPNARHADECAISAVLRKAGVIADKEDPP